MLTIIGCGNPNRSDDGVGPAVARLLAEHPKVKSSLAVRVFDAGTAGMDVMFQAKGSRALILVDASDTGGEPGAIFRLPGGELASVPEPSFTLHGFRWDHALYAGKKIFRGAFPEDVTVYLIERGKLDLGVGLSPPVQAAVERVVELIVEQAKTFVLASPSVRITRGSFYLGAELYEQYFHGAPSIAVTSVNGSIALMSLQAQAAGGLLAKVRNARGDRVIHAREFLLEQRVGDSEDHELSAEWNADLMALVVPNPNQAQVHGR
ncbi:MAG TPA: hydrogenase maturation protease [Polyangiaceae bacterium]|jgi:hydrogenase maturation protease